MSRKLRDLVLPSKTSRSAACLAFSLFFGGWAWAQPQPESAPGVPPTPIASIHQGTTTTEEERQEWRPNTLKIVRLLESSSRTDTSYAAYKEQLAKTKKELDVALKDASDEMFTFDVRNAMAHYEQAAEVLQFVSEAKNSAFVYRQKADGLLQIYVGKYKQVRKSDKLSERRADLVDAPLTQIWKEASSFLNHAQEWVDTPGQ